MPSTHMDPSEQDRNMAQGLHDPIFSVGRAKHANERKATPHKSEGAAKKDLDCPNTVSRGQQPFSNQKNMSLYNLFLVDMLY